MEVLQNILLECLRCSYDNVNEKCSIPEECDCDKLVSLAKQHDIDLVLEHSVKFPKYIRRSLNLQRESNSNNYMIMLKELAPVFENFDKHGIKYALCKGINTAICAYKHIGDRRFYDIDILVDAIDLESATKILNKFAFVQGRYDRKNNKVVDVERHTSLFFLAYTHQVARFVKVLPQTRMKYMLVDVNHHVLWGEAKEKYESFNIKEFLTNTEEIEYNGVKFKVLKKEFALMHMSLHLYNDMNSLTMLCDRKSYFLRGFLDLYLFIKNNKIAWSLLEKESKRLQIKSYIYYALYYTALVMDDDSILSNISETDDFASIYRDFFGLTDTERKTWKHSLWERIFCEDKEAMMQDYFDEADTKKVNYNYYFLDLEVNDERTGI